jgi:hypothetical protein
MANFTLQTDTCFLLAYFNFFGMLYAKIQEAEPYLEVDSVAGLNIRHPGGEERRGHPGVAVLAARDRRLPVSTLTAHPHLHITRYTQV